MQILLPRVIFLLFLLQLCLARSLVQVYQASFAVFLLLSRSGAVPVLGLFFWLQTLLGREVAASPESRLLYAPLSMLLWTSLGHRHQISTLSFQACFLGLSEYHPYFSPLLFLLKTGGVFMLSAVQQA